jgi:hypothetical protein
MRRRAVQIAMVLAVMVLAAGGAAAATRVDVEELASKGAASWQQWRQSSSKFSVTTALPNGVVVTMDVEHAPSRQRMVLRVQLGEQRQELERVIARDGCWYVTDARGQTKWRPYELPTDSVLFYAMLSRATPRFVDQENVESMGRARKVEGTVATFQPPLDDATAGVLRNTLAALDQFIVRNPQDPNTPKLREQATAIRTMLNEGAPVLVDLDTGQIIDQGAERFHTRSTVVTYVPLDEKIFDVGGAGATWIDHADDPTAGRDPNKLLMIGSFPGFQPGMREYELDGRLADLNTGGLRRIPYRGAVCQPGCFTKDRKRVIVCATAANGSVQPVVVDLSTGANRAIGGPLLAVGTTSAATLSPDGQRVAVVHTLPVGKSPEIHVFVIDLAGGGDGVRIGDPVDAPFVQWMPEGERLLVVSRRKPESPDGENESKEKAALTLCTMDLNGRLAPLCKGTAPVVVPQRKQILYTDLEDGLWHACDLEGKNGGIFASGYKGFDQPTVSPDGQQVLMLQENPPQPNRPVLFRFGDPVGQVLLNDPGTWGVPAWR